MLLQDFFKTLTTTNARRRRSRRQVLFAVQSAESLEARLLLTVEDGTCPEDDADPDDDGTGDPYGDDGDDPSSGDPTGSLFGNVDGLSFRPAGQQWFNNFGTEPLTGNTALARDLPGGLSLEYRSDTDGLPIVLADSEWLHSTPLTGAIEARLLIDGVQHSSVYLDATAIAQGDNIRVALRATTSLTSGRHQAEVQFIADVGNGPETQSVTQDLLVDNRSDSEFGTGWTLAGLERLVVETDGAVYVSGTGLTAWYAVDAAGGYDPASGSLANSPLTDNVDGTFTLQHGNGASSEFDADGLLTSRQDAFGNTSTFARDVSGVLQSVTDVYGRLTSFAWQNGLLSSVTDWASQTVDVLHDTAGQLTSITSSYYPGSGPQVPSVTDYAYDAAGRIASISDSIYHVTTLTYDEGGRLAQAVLPGGAIRTFDSVLTQAFVDPTGTVGTSSSPATIFDPAAAKATWTDPLGGVQESYVNEQGHVIRFVAVDGSETNYVRDTDGRITSVTRDDPDGSGPLLSPVTTYTYNTDGKRTQTVHPGGATESWTHDSQTRQRLTHTNVLGGVATYAWNTNRTLASVTDVNGGVTAYTYDTFGNVLTRTLPDPDGAGPQTSTVISTTRDAFGRATSTTVAGITTSRTYDAVGRVTSETDALSNVTSYVWTDLGRLSSVTAPDPDGTGPLTAAQQTFTWDWMGRSLSQTGADGRTVEFVYDTAGNLSSQTVVDPDGSGPLTDVVTSWTYDALGRRLTATDPLGNVSSTTYDAAGRILTATAPDPDGSGPVVAAVTTFVYDAIGRLIQQSDVLGNATGVAYDAAGNRFQTTDALGNVDSRTFDAAGQVTSTTDPLGNTASFAYNAAGQLLSTTLPDPDGTGPLTALQKTYTRDVLGRLISETNAAGLTTQYVYDSVGNLVTQTVVDPDGAGPLTDLVTNWTYDDEGRQLTETDAVGNVSSISYDGLGRILTVTTPDPDGSGPLTAAVTTFGYNDGGQLIQQTDALGNVTGFAYDAAGNQNQITDALGNVTASTHDAVGRVTATTDPLGRTTTFAYDNVGRLLSTTLPDPDDSGPLAAPQRTFTWRAGDVSPLISSVTFAGTTESRQYDALGRVISKTAADGSTTTYAFDAAGQLAAITGADPDGTGPLNAPVTSFTYDAAGRAIQQTAPDGSTTSSAYNDSGQRVSVTDGEGRTTSFGFDGFGRRIQTTDALGNVSSTVYDDLHRVTSTTDELSNVTSYVYDNLSHLISQANATGGTTSYAYNALGRRTSLTDPLNNVTSWTFDVVGQLLTDTNENGDSRSYTYDAARQLASRTDRNGRIITFGYDNLGRQIQQQWLDATSVAINTIATTYNADLRVASITDDDSAYAFTWDDAGRLLTSDNAGTAGVPNVVLASVFDDLGRQTQLSATIDGTGDFVNSYVYDTNSRVSSITQTDGSPSSGDVVSDKRVDLTYDNSGRFSTITRYEDLTATDEVATSTYSYDSTGRLSSLNHTFGSTTLSGYAWTWDAADRITSYTSVLDGSVAFGYDTTGQLTSEARTDTAGATVTSTFVYDANGNRTSASEPGTSVPGSYTTGLNNRTLSDGTYNYEYDAEGNRTKKTEISTGDEVEYLWNHANLLTDVIYNDSVGTTTKTVTYQYDALGRRIGKSVDDNGDGTVDRSQSFIYDGAGLLAASNGSITLSGPNGSLNQHGWVDDLVLVFEDADGAGPATTTLSSRLLHGPAIDQVFAQESVSGDILWALSDHQGTIKDWAESADFDADGTVETQIINHLQFDAFGNILPITDGSGNTTALDSRLSVLPAYTGQLYDIDAQLYYYKARWYDPAIGRFISEDPWGFAAGDANVSRYVGNSVINSVDPSGLDDRYDDPAGMLTLHIPDPLPPPPNKTGELPEYFFPVWVGTPPPKGTILAGIPILRQPQLHPRPPDRPPLASGGEKIVDVLEPGENVGVRGCGPCTGVIIIPPNPGMPTTCIHLTPVISHVGCSIPLLEPGHTAVIVGAVQNGDHAQNDENARWTLLHVIEELRDKGITPRAYIPTSSASVDDEGNIYWEESGTMGPDDYEP